MTLKKTEHNELSTCSEYRLKVLIDRWNFGTVDCTAALKNPKDVSESHI